MFGSDGAGGAWSFIAEDPGTPAGLARQGATLVLVRPAGQVWRTADTGRTWAQSTIDGLPSVGALSVTASPTGVFVGTKGAVARSGDSGATWSLLGMGLPSEARVEALTASGTTLLAAPGLAGIYRSTDDGQTFSLAVNGISPSVYNNAVATGLATWNGKVFAAFQGTGVFVSSDEGQSWAMASNGLPASGASRLWAAGSKLFAGPPTAGLYVTTDGATWAPTCGLPAGTSVMALASKGDALYLITTNNLVPGFFISTNGGASCSPAQLPRGSTGLDEPLAMIFAP
jgi:photosystem II stability/assembly factor-like uncharacterized protein